MLKAKDIMTTEVITVKRTTPIAELAGVLMEHRISGAPVVDEHDNLVGIVTENDLINQNKRFHIPTIMRLFDAYIMLESPSRMEKEVKKMAASTVADAYSEEVLTVTEETPVDEVATIMAEKRIHLIPVVEGRRIKGIIGKMDLIKGMAR